MAASRTLRPLLRPQHNHLPFPLSHQQTRTFLPNPFATLSALNGFSAPSQTLTATRTLPYASAPIYSIIADVSSYSTFIPYCQRSEVTKWSQPDQTYGRRWPSEGRLTVGFGGFEEQFTSRVYCVPGQAVESVGGQTETSLAASEIQHHLGDSAIARSEEVQSGLLTHLRSLWKVETRGKNSTHVRLELEFAFANPMYTALSAGAAPRVADKMIEAFESRVRSLLDNNPTMASANLEQLGGSEPKR